MGTRVGGPSNTLRSSRHHLMDEGQLRRWPAAGQILGLFHTEPTGFADTVNVECGEEGFSHVPSTEPFHCGLVLG